MYDVVTTAYPFDLAIRERLEGPRCAGDGNAHATHPSPDQPRHDTHPRETRTDVRKRRAIMTVGCVRDRRVVDEAARCQELSLEWVSSASFPTAPETAV